MEEIEQTKSLFVQLPPDSLSMTVLFNSWTAIGGDPLYRQLQNIYYIGVSCLIEEISLTSDIKSLEEATIPQISPSDNYQQKALKFQESLKQPHYRLGLYISSNSQNWIKKGEIILQNRLSPYYPNLLSPYFVSNPENSLPVGRSAEEEFKIGVRIDSPIYGALKSIDSVGIVLSYSLKFSLVRKQDSQRTSIALPFSVKVPVLRDSEEPVLVRPANLNRKELWLEIHSNDFSVWFSAGAKQGLNPKEGRGLAMYGKSAVQWFGRDSLANQHEIWALAVPEPNVPETDETKFVILSGIEMIQA